MNASVILQTVETIGIIVMGLGYLYSQFFKGKNDRTKEDIETENALVTYLTNQNKGFEKVVKEQDEKINSLGREMSAMQATILEKDKTMQAALLEKDKTIEKYLALIENRNPEMENFMVRLTKYADNADTFMSGQVGIMEEIKTFMQSINTHLEKEFTVKSTITKSS